MSSVRRKLNWRKVISWSLKNWTFANIRSLEEDDILSFILWMFEISWSPINTTDMRKFSDIWRWRKYFWASPTVSSGHFYQIFIRGASWSRPEPREQEHPGSQDWLEQAGRENPGWCSWRGDAREGVHQPGHSSLWWGPPLTSNHWSLAPSNIPPL